MSFLTGIVMLVATAACMVPVASLPSWKDPSSSIAAMKPHHQHRAELIDRQTKWRSSSSSSSSGGVACACENVSLCAPLTTPLPDKEIFAFQVSGMNWPFYDWNRLTSVILYDGLDPAMLCMAHSRNVRVIWSAGFASSQLLNASAVEDFITATVSNVVATNTDGINFDFEGLVEAQSPEFDALTALTLSLRNRLKQAIPTSSFTFDVAWSADHVDVRYYNYTEIISISDFVVIMDYDTRSQVFSGPPCYAGPNAPARTVTDGIASFLALPGVTPDKLVLGVPWYGYVYPCVDATSVTTQECQIASVPFRGVACSDAAGVQWPFSLINSFLRNATTQMFTPVMVNTTASGGGLYASVNVNDSSIQPVSHDPPLSKIYWDNDKTLREKYRIAKRYGLRGVSMWNVDCLSNSQTGPDAEDTKEMWRALDQFVVL